MIWSMTEWNSLYNIISQFCGIGKDCDQNDDRMSKNDEKLAYLSSQTFDLYKKSSFKKSHLIPKPGFF